jgi:hypothetical protein
VKKKGEVAKANLKAGAKAPFEGVLLSKAALAKLIADADKREATLRLEVERLGRERSSDQKADKKVCAAEVKAEKEKYQACERDRVRQFNACTKSLDRQASRSWVPWVAAVGGVLVGGMVCVGSVHAK